MTTTNIGDGPSPAPTEHDVDGWYPDPCDPTGARERRWDGVAWTPATRTRSGEPVSPPPWHRRPLSFLTHRWTFLMVLSLAAGAGALAVHQWVHQKLPVAALAALGAAFAACAFASHLDSRLRLGEVLGARLIAVVCLVSLPVVVAITMLEYPFQSDGLSNAVAGPIEEVAKLAVPFALYLLSARFRAPRAGVALVLASAATLGVFEAAGYAWHLPGSTATTAMASTVVWRPLWDAPVHMVLTGTIAAVLWRRWHSHGGLHIDLPMAVTVIGVMALHSVIDWSSDLRGSLSSLSLLGLVLAYMWFKMAVRQLAPPDAVAGNPPWWRPWRLPTATAAPQGSTRTSQPTDTRPGRRTAA